MSLESRVNTGTEVVADAWLSFKVKMTVIILCFFGQYSWKLLHPTDKYGNPNCPEEAEEYERVSRTVLHLVQLLHLCS